MVNDLIRFNCDRKGHKQSYVILGESIYELQKFQSRLAILATDPETHCDKVTVGQNLKAPSDYGFQGLDDCSVVSRCGDSAGLQGHGALSLSQGLLREVSARGY